MTGGSRLSRLATPRPERVEADPGGRPAAVAGAAPAARGAAPGGRRVAVGGRSVEAVRESWLIEDRWWTEKPLRRRYWEVVTADGRDLVVFRELADGRWFRHR